MFIYVISYTYYLFYANLNNYVILIILSTILLFFFNIKNFFTIFEYNIYIEDRVAILLENIINVDFNLVILWMIFLLSVNVVIKFTNFLLFFIYFIVYINDFIYFQEIVYMDFCTYTLNSKLLNGLFLIHPYCIYFFYSLFLASSTYVFITHKSIYQYNFLNKIIWLQKVTNMHKLIVFYVGTVGIILGSWWAYQEINWNNWWSWDLIELINLTLLILLMTILHTNLYSSTPIFNFYYYIILILFIIVSRYNILNSLHSFITSEVFEQFSYIFFTCCILISFQWHLVVKYDNKIINKFNKLVTISYLQKLFYMLALIFIYKIYFEIILFFINFDNNLDNIYFYKNLNLLIVIEYFLLCFKFSHQLYSWLFIFNFIEFIFLVIVCSLFFYYSWAYFILHFLIFFFTFHILFNASLSNFSLKLWHYTFIEYIENFKLNFTVLKKTIFVNNFSINNLNRQLINFYYIHSETLTFIDFHKKILFSLSNFFFYFSYIFILNYKFMFFYSIFMYNFFTLFFIKIYIYILFWTFLWAKGNYMCI